VVLTFLLADDGSTILTTFAPSASFTTYNSEFLPVDFEEVLSDLYSNNTTTTNNNNNNNNDTSPLLDPLSPQSQARSWLLSENLVNLTSSYALLQRYSLLVFHFSTNSTNSSSTGGEVFLVVPPDEHECDGQWFWGGITCDVTTQEVLYFELTSSLGTGTIPSELGLLTGLRELNFYNNSFSGTIPFSSSWQYLYLLDLSENIFTGLIPTELWSLPILRFLYLNDNQLNGTLPAVTTNASNYTEQIFLYSNQLQGTLPDWMSKFPQLKDLSMFSNLLSGPLPTSWESSKSVQTIDLSFNLFSGALPESLLLNTSLLERLYLESNQLGGSLPALAQSPQSSSNNQTTTLVKALFLQSNNFEGTFPSGFAGVFDQLTDLRVHNNTLLTGSLQCQDYWPNLQSLHADCLSDLVQCDCCTACY